MLRLDHLGIPTPHLANHQVAKHIMHCEARDRDSKRVKRQVLIITLCKYELREYLSDICNP